MGLAGNFSGLFLGVLFFSELTFIQHEKLHEQMPATPWNSGSLNELLGVSKERNKEGKRALTFVLALPHTVSITSLSLSSVVCTIVTVMFIP